MSDSDVSQSLSELRAMRKEMRQHFDVLEAQFEVARAERNRIELKHRSS